MALVTRNRSTGMCRRNPDTGVLRPHGKSCCCCICGNSGCVRVTIANHPIAGINGEYWIPNLFPGAPINPPNIFACGRYNTFCEKNFVYTHNGVDFLAIGLHIGAVLWKTADGRLKVNVCRMELYFANRVRMRFDAIGEATSAPGCDQTIVLEPNDVEHNGGDWKLEIVGGIGGCDDNACIPNGCDTCCPQINCMQATLKLERIYPFPGPAGEHIINLGRGVYIDPSSTGRCYFGGECVLSQCSGNIGQSRRIGVGAFVYCTPDGDIIVHGVGVYDVTHFCFPNVPSFSANSENTEPIYLDSCGNLITPEMADLVFNEGRPTESRFSVSLELRMQETCDKTECSDPIGPPPPPPPPPTSCPVPCFECDGIKLCPTDAKLTIGFTITSRECGTCGGDCAWCCDCSATCHCPHHPDPQPPPGLQVVPQCPCFTLFNQIACEGAGHEWYCDPECTDGGDGGGGTVSSPCSRMSLNGTNIDIPCIGVVGGNLTFQKTIAFPGTTIVIRIWYVCVLHRWFTTITVNGRCEFFGDLNGVPNFYPGAPGMKLRDSVLGTNCVSGTGHTGGSFVHTKFGCGVVPQPGPKPRPPGNPPQS